MLFNRLRKVDAMSEFEINKAVAIANNQRYGLVEVIPTFVRLMNTETMPAQGLDYCNNPSDAWPIILENKIHTGWAFDDLWRADITNQGQAGPFRKEEAVNKNPLRAAMIVFLKRKEDK